MKRSTATLPAVTEPAHSALAPSAAHRWAVCGGSVALIGESKIPDLASEAAQLGTAAHKLHELALRENKSPEAWRGKHLEGQYVDTDMIDAVETSVDYLRMVARKTLGALSVEHRVTLPLLDMPGSPGQGHIDAMIHSKDTLFIHDYKHGAGVFVGVAENKQLMLYALGALEALPRAERKAVKTVTLSIAQPRCYSDEPIRAWATSPAHIEAFAAGIARQVENIRLRAAPLVPGDHQCRWCPAKARCPALAEHAGKQAGIDFAQFLSTEQLPAAQREFRAKSLTDAQLAAALSHLDLLRMYADAVEAEAMRLALAGTPPPGWKLVEGRAQRMWVDENDVQDALARDFTPDMYAPRKLLGLGAIEKLLPKEKRAEFMALHAVKPRGKPALAPSSDPRPPYVTTDAHTDFKDLLC